MRVFNFLILFIFLVVSITRAGVISVSGEKVDIVFVNKITKKRIIKHYHGNKIPSVSLRMLKEKYKKNKEAKNSKELGLNKNFKIYDKKIKYNRQAGIKKLNGRNLVTIEYRFDGSVQLKPLSLKNLKEIVMIREGIKTKVHIPKGYYPVLGYKINKEQKKIITKGL